MKPTVRSILIAGSLLTIAFVVVRNFCPASGLALTSSRFGIHRLKNRTAIPQASDFDERITLEKLLAPGADQARWSDSRAVRLEGYVVSISPGPFEAANCYCARDIHIMLAARSDAGPQERIVLEITPRIKAGQSPAVNPASGNNDSRSQNAVVLQDWSLDSLNRELLRRRVRVEGWLFFDSQHANESESTAPGRADNWRATAWELHPITKIEILK